MDEGIAIGDYVSLGQGRTVWEVVDYDKYTKMWVIRALSSKSRAMVKEEGLVIVQRNP